MMQEDFQLTCIFRLPGNCCNGPPTFGIIFGDPPINMPGILPPALGPGPGSVSASTMLKEMIDHGSEMRGWWNVQIHYCKKLETAFISGHPTRHEPREIVLPLESCQTVSLETIQTYLENIKLDDCSTNRIMKVTGSNKVTRVIVVSQSVPLHSGCGFVLTFA
ncbi:hypothetical protein KUTeg_011437 [Tegillarca granosa]|uniref:tRNA-splicing endonuclease subunit Sen15 domain-containing protein n=1 Tax=Tegillarca granosa TaxID=220873 RepID=A0ABQ9F517_TEGGR|nr:hypothetical protein KUTeg_011437 [Tegillarca granosa]